MEEKKNKKILKTIMIIVLLIIVVGIGITIAYFTAQSLSNTQTIKTGKLAITYNDGTNNLKVDNIVPIYDKDMQTKANRITFNAYNEGTMTGYMDISIEDIVIPEELESLEFKWAIYETDETYTELKSKVNNGNFRNIENAKQLVANNIKIEPKERKYYNLYIWIRETELNQDEMKGKTFSGKIVIRGNQEDGQMLLSEKIKKDNDPIKEDVPNFSKAPNGDEGLIKDTDEDGDTYYFRGAVEDNYVKINGLTAKNDYLSYLIDSSVYHTRELAENACNLYYKQMEIEYSSEEECKSDIKELGYKTGEEYLWRIVRINGDNTIRLMLDGSIGYSAFNENSGDEKYVGYTYDNPAPNKQNGESSTIKKYLDNWYSENMMDYDKYIAHTRYCNDTTVSSISGNTINYGAHDRIEKGQPSFQCENTTKNYGGEYDLKVGLISADEVVFAGGSLNSGNFYMVGKSYDFFTATPSELGRVFELNSSSSIDSINMDIGDVDISPIINLKSNLLYTSGYGSKISPYLVG